MAVRTSEALSPGQCDDTPPGTEAIQLARQTITVLHISTETPMETLEMLSKMYGESNMGRSKVYTKGIGVVKRAENPSNLEFALLRSQKIRANERTSVAKHNEAEESHQCATSSSAFTHKDRRNVPQEKAHSLSLIVSSLRNDNSSKPLSVIENDIGQTLYTETLSVYMKC
ncbi:hypothetical protein TNCV_2281101 [Trichonephila clavipes]|nr:hypothetical protein TNCV_2281101 [Trichonephila clavipes]